MPEFIYESAGVPVTLLGGPGYSGTIQTDTVSVNVVNNLAEIIGLGVEVNIAARFVQDVALTLIAPDGTRKLLWNYSGDANDTFDPPANFGADFPPSGSLSENPIFDSSSSVSDPSDPSGYLGRTGIIRPADSLTSLNSGNRHIIRNSFKKKEINYLFVVDIFNEGVDIPECNTVIRFDEPGNFRSYIQSKVKFKYLCNIIRNDYYRLYIFIKPM
jgi:hypothetical protein